MKENQESGRSTVDETVGAAVGRAAEKSASAFSDAAVAGGRDGQQSCAGSGGLETSYSFKKFKLNGLFSPRKR
jgi:hypothetical protein